MENHSSNTFGAWLVSARRGAGWSQARIADESGITQGMVSSLERGSRNPSRHNALSLARALACDSSAALHAAGFLSDTDNLAGTPHSSTVRLHAAGWDELSDQDQGDVLDYIAYKLWQKSAASVVQPAGAREFSLVDSERAYALAAYRGRIPATVAASQSSRKPSHAEIRNVLAQADEPDNT